MGKRRLVEIATCLVFVIMQHCFGSDLVRKIQCYKVKFYTITIMCYVATPGKQKNWHQHRIYLNYRSDTKQF